MKYKGTTLSHKKTRNEKRKPSRRENQRKQGAKRRMGAHPDWVREEGGEIGRSTSMMEPPLQI